MLTVILSGLNVSLHCSSHCVTLTFALAILVIALSFLQAQQLSSEVCGGYVKVDEYVPGQHMRVAYWRPMGATQFLSAFLLNQARGVLLHCATTHCPYKGIQIFHIKHT